MQLVETEIHIKCNPHLGAVELVKKYHNLKKY